MPKVKSVELQKHTLNLRQGDFEKMGTLFPAIGASEAIRRLVSKFIDKHLPSDTSET